MHYPMDLSYLVARIFFKKAHIEKSISIFSPDFKDPGGTCVANLDLCPVCLGKTKIRVTEICYRCKGNGLIPFVP